MVKTTHEEGDDSGERAPVGPHELPPVGTGGRRVILEAGPGSPGPIVTCKHCGVAVDASTPAALWKRDRLGKFWKMVPHNCAGTHGFLRVHPKRLVPPDDVLAQWVISDWPCLALDGCEVEPDGTCEHGFPSWLVYLQMREGID